MKLYNTLTRKKEEFVPIEEGKVKMYVCGPTVYNYIHIGNARPYVTFDTVRRYMEYKGYEVTYVQNFTDVDDKIIKKANEENTTMEVISNRYIEECFRDADGLNVKRASYHPRVTEEMDYIIEMISNLIEKGHAYEDNGTVYFDTKSFPEYGKLSKKNLDELIAGASDRVAVDDAKKNPTDFVLWKPFKPGEPKWKSPWGEGRPGWHIECSVMAKRYLGPTIDIHAGGEDLVFPHHENEIAQSEACNGVPFAKYWIHNGFITVDNEKMSKSAGNFFTVRDIAAEFPYEVIRFFILNGQYRSPINFSRELMESCQNGLERIKNCKKDLAYYIENCSDIDLKENENLDEIEKFKLQFEEAMDDDFNTADAVSAVYELVRFINKNSKDGVSKAYAKKEMDMFKTLTTILGIAEDKEAAVDKDAAKIEELIAKRTEAKKNKDFAAADAIREELTAMGITIKDTRQGVQWFRG
ncbi:MAG TPA: cysteine--tRNA ligase [Lachnospiraceae bacterium]|nr:cysteine--tRNA ligase [Lachnospiraceae bacterium]